MLLGAAARRRHFPLLFIIVIGFVRSCNAGGQENTDPRHDPSGEKQDRLIDGGGAGDLENAPEQRTDRKRRDAVVVNVWKMQNLR